MKREPAPPIGRDVVSGNGELAFLRDPLESLGRAFDAILAVVAFGREQPDHLIGAAGGRTRHVAGREIDRPPTVEFVLQRPLHHARTPAALTVPLAIGRLKTPGNYVARGAPFWPVHRDM